MRRPSSQRVSPQSSELPTADLAQPEVVVAANCDSCRGDIAAARRVGLTPDARCRMRGDLRTGAEPPRPAREGACSNCSSLGRDRRGTRVRDVCEAIEPTDGAPPYHPRPRIHRAAVVALYQTGLTQQQVAQRLGCSETSVSRSLRLAGVPCQARWRSSPRARGRGRAALGTASRSRSSPMPRAALRVRYGPPWSAWGSS